MSHTHTHLKTVTLSPNHNPIRIMSSNVHIYSNSRPLISLSIDDTKDQGRQRKFFFRPISTAPSSTLTRSIERKLSIRFLYYCFENRNKTAKRLSKFNYLAIKSVYFDLFLFKFNLAKVRWHGLARQSVVKTIGLFARA